MGATWPTRVSLVGRFAGAALAVCALSCADSRAIGQDESEDSGGAEVTSAASGSSASATQGTSTSTTGPVDTGADEGPVVECDPGEFRSCECEAGTGYELCDDDGLWGTCQECGPPSPPPGWELSCNEDSECTSGHCFQVPILGGLCSECTQDLHCPGGSCASINPLASTPAYCTAGELGDGCQSEGCDPGLSCEQGLDVPGVMTMYGCSNCAQDADCDFDPARPLCGLNVDLGEFQGHRACVAPGAVALGSACQLGGSGDQACASGACVELDVMGLTTYGVCGQCDEQRPCPGGLACTPVEADLTTGIITPSMCQ